jgi:nicotinate-nucleotide adenylyltransferase
LFSLYTARVAGNEQDMTYTLPPSHPGQVIGLLGGSFDPPHAGHLHISREALKRFGLDRLWWLVSPGNPLKARGPAPLERRIRAARDLVDHPRIDVTDFEAQAGRDRACGSSR